MHTPGRSILEPGRSQDEVALLHTYTPTDQPNPFIIPYGNLNILQQEQYQLTATSRLKLDEMVNATGWRIHKKQSHSRDVFKRN